MSETITEQEDLSAGYAAQAATIRDLQTQVQMLEYWKADALERIADDERAYAELVALNTDLQQALAVVYDKLHEANSAVIRVIEIKRAHEPAVVKAQKVRARKVGARKTAKLHNAEVTGGPLAARPVD